MLAARPAGSHVLTFLYRVPAQTAVQPACWTARRHLCSPCAVAGVVHPQLLAHSPVVTCRVLSRRVYDMQQRMRASEVAQEVAPQAVSLQRRHTLNRQMPRADSMQVLLAHAS